MALAGCARGGSGHRLMAQSRRHVAKRQASARVNVTLIPLYQSDGVWRHAFLRSARTRPRTKRRRLAAAVASRARRTDGYPLTPARSRDWARSVWAKQASVKHDVQRRQKGRPLKDWEGKTASTKPTARRKGRKRDQPPSATLGLSGESPWPGARTTTGVPTLTRL
jgi:hypothetical protein